MPNTNLFVLIFKGFLLGIAAIIPGLSAGTLALLLGIYQQLTKAISQLSQRSWKAWWSSIHFLVPLLIGGLASILVLAKIVGNLYEQYPEQVNFFFLGVIAASLPSLMHHLSQKIKWYQWMLFIIALAFTLYLGILDKQSTIDSQKITFLQGLPLFLRLFITGAIASATMLLPGISGSFILLLLGEYYHILNLVETREWLSLGIVALGGICGILFCAKLINHLLAQHFQTTIVAILGLVVASLYVLWPGLTVNPLSIIYDLVFFGIGFYLIFRFARIQ